MSTLFKDLTKEACVRAFFEERKTCLFTWHETNWLLSANKHVTSGGSKAIYSLSDEAGRDSNYVVAMPRVDFPTWERMVPEEMEISGAAKTAGLYSTQGRFRRLGAH